MKFTSEDLLKAMGLKVGDTFILEPNLKFKVCIDNDEELFIYKFDTGENFYLTDFLRLEYDMGDNYTIIQPKPTLTEDEPYSIEELLKE